MNKRNNSKGNIFIALAKFHTWAFILGAVFLIIAGGMAYSTFMEGKTAQDNAMDLLVRFEQKTERQTSTDPKSTINTTLGFAPKTIAVLNIDAINLNLPVLSEWSYELLDISVCKYEGANPNEPGNFIIIGHNFLNGAHFGNLYLVKYGDIVDITDLTGREEHYVVYEILLIKPDETDKLSTDEESTVTLVTCDYTGDMRLIIKCKKVTTAL